MLYLIIFTFIISLMSIILSIFLLYNNYKKWEWESLQDKEIETHHNNIEEIYNILKKEGTNELGVSDE